jgi:transposase
VEKCPQAKRLATHAGVGPLTALGFVLIIGKAERFRCGKQIASYLGLVPSEESSGDRRRLGHISKQGSTLLRLLRVKRSKSRFAASRNGAVSILTWRCGAERPASTAKQ